MAVHLWESREAYEAYEAWASERAEVTAKAKEAIGVTIAEAELYEVLQIDGPAQTKGSRWPCRGPSVVGRHVSPRAEQNGR